MLLLQAAWAIAMLVEGCEDNAAIVVSTPYALEVRAPRRPLPPSPSLSLLEGQASPPGGMVSLSARHLDVRSAGRSFLGRAGPGRAGLPPLDLALVLSGGEGAGVCLPWRWAVAF